MNTKLYDQTNFYKALDRDLVQAKQRVIIESPFLTTKRVTSLLPILRKLVKKHVQVIINTKPFNEHNEYLKSEAIRSIAVLQENDILVLMTIGHHRKLVIIDQTITWEGSLNILSQNDSCEIMRRIESEEVTRQTIKFLHLDRFHKMK